MLQQADLASAPQVWACYCLAMSLRCDGAWNQQCKGEKKDGKKASTLQTISVEPRFTQS